MTPRVSFESTTAWLRRHGHFILLGLGVVALVLLVRHVGMAALWSTLCMAGPWLPLILALDAAWVFTEGFALLLLYGPERRRIPPRRWLDTLLTHYVTMVVLPVGRAGAEVTRATMLSPHVGAERATAAAARMQAVVLLANTVISVPCMLAVALYAGRSTDLLALLALNALATMVLGGGLYAVTRQVKIGGWLGRRFKKMAHWGPELDKAFGERPRFPWRSLAVASSARVIQVLQYGVILVAVGGELGILASLVAEGIHLVGAGLGDMVPNQVGITEGAYRWFASSLGLEATPEKAVAIALIARISNLGVAGLCFTASTLWSRAGKSALAQSASEQLASEQPASEQPVPTSHEL